MEQNDNRPAAEATTERTDNLLHGEARANAIEGMRQLLELLEADDSLPIDDYAFRFHLYPRDAGIDEGNNAEAVCWLGTVAGALGVDVMDILGDVPSEKTMIYEAERDFGDHVRYRAAHTTPEQRAKAAARKAAAAEGGAA
jgi:hypothetical protein